MPPRKHYTADDYGDYDDYDDDYDDGYDAYDVKPSGARAGVKANAAPARTAKGSSAKQVPSKAAAKPRQVATGAATLAAPADTLADAAGSAYIAAATSVASDAASAAPQQRRAYRDPKQYAQEPELRAALVSTPRSKPALHVVVLGHVDAGKSTLMGRLIADLGFVDERVLRKTLQEAQTAGRGSFGWAWAFDERPEERTHGVTMDVSMRNISTEKFTVTLLDAPGHKDFVPNMITGAAQADAAVLVVDGSHGGFEASFQPARASNNAGMPPAAPGQSPAHVAQHAGQLREHVHVARSMGVKQLAVVITKLDTCDFAEGRFRQVQGLLEPFLHQCGYRDVQWLPASAPAGQNVSAAPTDNRLAAWWPSGRTLVDAINRLQPVSRALQLPLRMVVSDIVSKPSLSGRVGAAGKVDSGAVRVGADVYVLPAGVLATVKGIEINGESVAVAAAGAAAEVGLAGVQPEEVGSGSCLCHPGFPVCCAKRLKAQIVVVNAPRPLIPGQAAVLHLHSTATPCSIGRLVSLLDAKTGAVRKTGPGLRVLMKDQMAIVELVLEHEVCAEATEGPSCLKRIVLRMGGTIIAVGAVQEVLPD